MEPISNFEEVDAKKADNQAKGDKVDGKYNFKKHFNLIINIKLLNKINGINSFESNPLLFPCIFLYSN